MDTRALQRALIARGYDLGGAGADGVFGRMTIAAVKAFQADRGLDVKWPGTVGPKTIAALSDGGTEQHVEAPWYAEATRLMGTREIVGAKHSGVIMGWAERLGIWYPSDETAWCGLFVAHCIGLTLPDEPMPSNPLGARNWSSFGGKLATPAPGAVLVFWRGSGRDPR